jgi:parvulin-like peptidyl-prolyl isomerase
VDTKKEAQAIYDELQNGADFATLAKEKSQDPGSADQGGKLTDERGSFVPEFEEVAFSIETGEIAEPVKSDFGWHVITALADTKPASTTPFEEAKTQIEDTVLQQRKNEVMADWVADVMKKYDVVYAPGFQPLADTGVDHSATTAPATTAP